MADKGGKVTTGAYKLDPGSEECINYAQHVQHASTKGSKRFPRKFLKNGYYKIESERKNVRKTKQNLLAS